jgi:hypothetical protein
LLFSTRDGEEFTLQPGDVLLAEDTVGTGHQWQAAGRRPLATDVRRAGAGDRGSVHPTSFFAEQTQKRLNGPD